MEWNVDPSKLPPEFSPPKHAFSAVLAGDGFAAKINIGPGNRFFDCVAHDNSDDGWDTFPKTASGTNVVTIENCVVYHNGYHKGVAAGNGNGFKVGSDQTGGGALSRRGLQHRAQCAPRCAHRREALVAFDGQRGFDPVVDAGR